MEHSPYSYCFNNPLKMTDASGMSPKGEKRKEQTFGTEIDMKGLNDAYASIMQSRYESSRQPPMIDYIVSYWKRKLYNASILPSGIYNNLYGGGSGSGSGRTGSKGNGSSGYNSWSYKDKTFNNRNEFIEYLQSEFKNMTLKQIRDRVSEQEGFVTDEVTVFGDRIDPDYYDSIQNRIDYLKYLLGSIDNFVTSADNLFFKAFIHYQIGGGKDLTIDAATMDVSGISQKDIQIDKFGNLSVGLSKLGIFNNLALSIGKVGLLQTGDNTFIFQDDGYNFNIEWQNGLSSRNIKNTIGFLVNNGFGAMPFSINPLLFGGTYNIKFINSVTINP